MKTTIGAFDAESGTVPVKFEYASVTHRRTVNACLTEAGKYDAKSTKLRVGKVALGVERKIDLGVVTNPPPEPEPELAPEPEAPAL